MVDVVASEQAVSEKVVPSAEQSPQLTQEQRHKILVDKIELSKAHAIHKDTASRGLLFQSVATHEIPYQKAAGVFDRQITDSEVAVAGAWAAQVARGMVLQAPEYQAVLPTIKDRVKGLRSTFFGRDLDPDDFFANSSPMEFKRGEAQWRFVSESSDNFNLSAQEGGVTDVVRINTKGQRPIIQYIREEALEGTDSRALLSEENTDVAFTGLQELLTRFRESGELQEMPKELLENSNSIWRDLLKTDVASVLTRGIPLATTIAGALAHPSTETAIAGGLSAAFAAFKTRSDLKEVRRDLKSEAAEIIVTSNMEWGHPPR